MKAKNVNISVIRLVSLIMIISCHILQGLGNEFAFWVNLGVQIFFFMSGYLYGKKSIDNWEEFYKKRIIKILIPNTILVIIVTLNDLFVFDIKYPKIYLIANALGFGGIYGTLKTLSHTWFVSYILICYLLTPLLQLLFDKNKDYNKNLILLLFILTTFSEFHVINLNSAWLGNYILGYYFTSCCQSSKQQQRFFYTLLALTTIFLPSSLILKYNLISNIPNVMQTFSGLICSWEHVLLGCILFLSFEFIFSKIHIKYNFILKFSDKYNYFIYLTHQIFILNYISVLHLTKKLWVNIIIIYILSILSGIGLYYVYNATTYFFKKIKYYFHKNIVTIHNPIRDYYDIINNCGDFMRKFIVYLFMFLLLCFLIYQSSVEKKNRALLEQKALEDKIILFSGDSICRGTINDYFGWSYYIGKNSLFKENIDASAGGATVSTSRSDNRLVNQLKPYKNIDVDYLILHGGINDAMDSVPLGEMTDSFDVKDFDITTFAGGLEEYFYYATRYFGNARIGYIVNYRTPNAKSFGGYTSDPSKYFSLAKKIARKWHIPVLDFYDGEINRTPFSNIIGDKYLADHLHLNEKGYELTTPYIIKFLEKLPKYRFLEPDYKDPILVYNKREFLRQTN